ncbi:MAG: D-glycero-beta-D-manno-heptose-7-phosphate kinase [Flavobacteriales bacterium]|nr:D-glycero-beta-D-manno-heptose-7-phosphate kinase [Flavobacteriales bacterium]|tara:strand:- start:1704 stop:2681 length:978 start_codon:yes stop_codon:yes gene_type:complete
MDFEQLFNEFKSKRVLIIGDSMIDAYMWGKINRMSPEAPVPVVEINKHENRLGGAANVALNLKALGATPILCSVIGDGNRGKLFKELMQEEELSTEGILLTKGRKTTTKTRVIAQLQHQLRVDEEDIHPIQNEDKFLEIVTKLINDMDVVILQDYNKGVLTHKIIQEVIKITNKQNIPTIVDPKSQNFYSYKNCTIFKPNLAEINSGMNINCNADNMSELEKASSELKEILNAKGILLTLAEKGICINTNQEFKHTPAFKRKIIDVSGAGDTVVSVASLCLASNLSFLNLSILSALAGGIVCEDVGVVPINKDKLLSEAKKHIIL